MQCSFHKLCNILGDTKQSGTVCKFKYCLCQTKKLCSVTADNIAGHNLEKDLSITSLVFYTNVSIKYHLTEEMRLTTQPHVTAAENVQEGRISIYATSPLPALLGPRRIMATAVDASVMCKVRSEKRKSPTLVLLSTHFQSKHTKTESMQN